MLVLLPGWIGELHAVQYSLESDVSARAEYHDNIFLTTVPHDSVYGLVVTPQISLVAKEPDWETSLNTKFIGNRYSDSNLNSNDLFFVLDSSLRQEINTLSLSVVYNRDSSLNSESSDFGITGKRVKSRLMRLSPGYQLDLTERTRLSLSLSRTEVDYEDNDGTGFLPYTLSSASSRLFYVYSATKTLTFDLQYTDYESDDGAFQYQLEVVQVGLQQQFDELWSFNGSIGASRRSSTNETTQSIDFFGQPVTLVQVNDFTSSGVVLDARISRKLETGDVIFSLSRSNTANSFGGLNEVNTAKLSYSEKWSELWRHTLSLRYDDVNAVSIGVRTTDRTALFAEARVMRQFSREWNMNVSYRYATRKFATGSVSNADSNRLFLGLTYNFPDISTF